MQETEEKKIASAADAGEEEISRYVYDPSPKVIRVLLENRRLTEEDVLVIANRKNLPGDILKSIARDKRWTETYAIRLALARNPRSPLSVSLPLAYHLRLFDLEEITRSHFIPLAFRHKVEMMITERIITMPLGNKKTLAKKATGTVLLKLLQDRDPEVVTLCLNNPHLTEGHLFKIISRADSVAETIRMIAVHPNWSSRSLVRLALVRNNLAPLSLSIGFLQDMKVTDLRELYADPSVPRTIKPFIHRELWERGVEPKMKTEEQVFEADENDDEEIDAFGETGEE